MDLYNPHHFWNTFKFRETEIGHWKFGPLSLWLKRLENEWKIWWKYSQDPLDFEFHQSFPFAGPTPSRENIFEKRFGLTRTEEEIRLVPTLPNRCIVTRPDPAFYILPHEEVSLFISVPLWVRIETASRTLIDEIPVYHLSNTWFGSPSGDGEFCYFIKTGAKLRLADLPERFHRAVTAIYIKNQGKSNLFLERIKIPTPNLALFKNEQDLFFTQSIALESEKDATLAQLRLNQRPHPEAGPCELAYQPRLPLKENIIIKTLNNFL